MPDIVTYIRIVLFHEKAYLHKYIFFTEQKFRLKNHFPIVFSPFISKWISRYIFHNLDKKFNYLKGNKDYKNRDMYFILIHGI